MALIDLSGLPSKEVIPGIEAQFIHTSNLTIGYFTIKKGSILPEHAHIHEQITHVLSGRLEMTIDGITEIAEAGKIAVIPADSRHKAIALTDCKVLDVFYPVREDYKMLMNK